MVLARITPAWLTTVGSVSPTVVNQAGVIRANTIAEQGAYINLSGGAHGVVKVSGTIEARGDGAGEKGGTIKVLGDKVAIAGTATLDAGGQAGGGTVLVGGNWQGKGRSGTPRPPMWRPVRS